MKVLELFAGTRSIGRAFEAKGHEVFSVDWDSTFEDIDACMDIMELTADMVREKFGQPDVIWASPDCTTFSIAAISHHRKQNKDTGNLDPVSDYAKLCDRIDQHVLQLINELKPKYWFIENPRGHEEDELDAGFVTIYCDILPVRRYPHEAHRYFGLTIQILSSYPCVITETHVMNQRHAEPRRERRG